MPDTKWYDTVTIEGKNLSISQRILLYLYTLPSFNTPEEIPIDDCRTTQAIIENVGGSVSGVVKALKSLTTINNKEGSKRVPLIKIRPRHGRGRLPGSPPIYYSLTRYGEVCAQKLFRNLEFDITIRTNKVDTLHRGNYKFLKDLCGKQKKEGRKIDVSDEKKVLREIIRTRKFDVESSIESQLIKVITIESQELLYPIDIVYSATTDMELIAKVTAKRLRDLIGNKNFKIDALGKNEYTVHVESVGMKHRLFVRMIESNIPYLTRYSIDVHYGEQRYKGWVDIQMFSAKTNETMLVVKTYAEDFQMAMELRNAPILTDIIEKMALEVLKTVCQIIDSRK